MHTSNILQGEHIRLTALTLEDIPRFAPWYQDAGFMRLFAAVPANPKSEPELKEWLEERHKDPNGFIFAIRPAAGDDLLGFAELDGILWPHQVGGVAIAIGDAENQGKGYGREAMELLLRFAFMELNLHRLQLTAFSYNARAVALYESLGFRREGVFREFLQRDGRRHDMVLFGLLRHEWARARDRNL